jgi:hypothetical protein
VRFSYELDLDAQGSFHGKPIILTRIAYVNFPEADVAEDEQVSPN